MVSGQLEQSFIQCLMCVGPAPQKPAPLNRHRMYYDEEQIDQYNKWLDYHYEVETFYFDYVVNYYAKSPGRASGVEDWMEYYFSWLKANNPPQVSDFYHRPPTIAFLHACKGRKK